MSLLKRLSERAQELKQGSGDIALSVELRKRRFNEITVPLLKDLEAFLRELSRSLKAIKPDVRQKFEIPGYGQIESIPTFDYLMVCDHKMLEWTLELRWKSRVDSERAPRIVLNTPDRVRSLNEVLKRMTLGGIREEKRGPSGSVISAVAQVTGFVNSKLSVRSVLDNDDNDDVIFTFENVDQIGSVRRVMPVRLIGQEAFDRLGEFILRENDLFVRETWFRGLQPIERVLSETPFVPQVESKKPKHMIADLTPKDFAPPKPTEEELARTALLEEKARERELDFLAELKMASRYADQAVKRLGDSGESGEFGSERDFSSLRSAFQKQTQTGKTTVEVPAVVEMPAAVELSRALPEAAIVPTAPPPAPVAAPDTILTAATEPPLQSIVQLTAQPATVPAISQSAPAPLPRPSAEQVERSKEFVARFQSLKEGLSKIKKES
jgi:hypothetical protein